MQKKETIEGFGDALLIEKIHRLGQVAKYIKEGNYLKIYSNDNKLGEIKVLDNYKIKEGSELEIKKLSPENITTQNFYFTKHPHKKNNMLLDDTIISHYKNMGVDTEAGRFPKGDEMEVSYANLGKNLGNHARGGNYINNKYQELEVDPTKWQENITHNALFNKVNCKTLEFNSGDKPMLTGEEFAIANLYKQLHVGEQCSILGKGNCRAQFDDKGNLSHGSGYMPHRMDRKIRRNLCSDACSSYTLKNMNLPFFVNK